MSIGLSLPAASPSFPPAQICGNAILDGGPVIAPPGAVTVPAGDNATFFQNEGFKGSAAAGTIYWFAPNIHTLGTSIYGQITPADNTTFIGAPGAILDGQGINRFAFTTTAPGVTIKYLTIQNFNAPQDQGVVNHDSGNDWTIQFCTIRNNHGAAVMAGARQQMTYNCLADNGQYGFNAFQAGDGITDLFFDHNEIKGNNTDDLETKYPGCGCTGGGKFWAVKGAIVSNNWVHDNYGAGLWADTNNSDFLFEGNYIENNDSQAIFYEISYNAVIRNNTIKRNSIVSGLKRQASGNNFPEGAIYLSEAGGDARVRTTTTGTGNLEIYGNDFENNWDGVVLWENADRFCGSPANTSSGYCTSVNPGAANFGTCKDPASAGTIDVDPAYSDCRWKTQNVKVHDNTFSFDPSAVGCTATNLCGRNAVFSQYGTFPTWSPYKKLVIQDAITFYNNNVWSDNTYIGPWQYMPHDTGNQMNFSSWQKPPYNQDIGSSFNGMIIVTVPLPPSKLSAQPASSSAAGVSLSWKDNSLNETGFKIERKDGPSGLFLQIAPISANATTYADDGLTAGIQYSYRVRATNSAGDSAYSAIANITLVAFQTLDLAVVKIFPNPFKASKQTQMTFLNMPDQTRLRIYTLTGELIYETTADSDGIARWDGAMQSGQEAASGVYLAHVDKDGKTKTYKIAFQK